MRIPCKHKKKHCIYLSQGSQDFESSWHQRYVVDGSEKTKSRNSPNAFTRQQFVKVKLVVESYFW